jgi:hemoglobin
VKVRLCAASLAVLLFSVGVSAAPPAAKKQDFKDTMADVMAAWSTLDVSKVAPYYAPEAGRVFYDVTPVKYDGWAVYASGVLKEFAEAKTAKLTLNPDAQYEVHGKRAWSAATVKFELELKAGAKETAVARWTALWEKRDAGWVIIHDHFSFPQPSAEETAAGSLYKRLGGYDGIAAVMDDFLGRLAADPQLRRFFGGTSADTQRHLRQLFVDQVCALIGGPCHYVGRSMKTAHAGLGITEGEWQAMAADFVKTLDKFHVAERERQELLKAVSALKPDIVEK